ncbi:MAG TPA: hypothetical protein HA362_06300 [Nanoarchaeota archaeon]|nr:hypothetical protein [Nanoarchaeota archaeon]
MKLSDAFDAIKSYPCIAVIGSLDFPNNYIEEHDYWQDLHYAFMAPRKAEPNVGKLNSILAVMDHELGPDRTVFCRASGETLYYGKLYFCAQPDPQAEHYQWGIFTLVPSMEIALEAIDKANAGTYKALHEMDMIALRRLRLEAIALKKN